MPIVKFIVPGQGTKMMEVQPGKTLGEVAEELNIDLGEPGQVAVRDQNGNALSNPADVIVPPNDVTYTVTRKFEGGI